MIKNTLIKCCYGILFLFYTSVAFSFQTYMGYIVPKDFENIINNEQLSVKLFFNKQLLGNVFVHIANKKLHMDDAKYVAFLLSEHGKINRILLEQQLKLPIILYQTNHITIKDLNLHPLLAYYNDRTNTLNLYIATKFYNKETAQTFVNPPTSLSAIIQNNFHIYSDGQNTNITRYKHVQVILPALTYNQISYVGWGRNYMHTSVETAYYFKQKIWSSRIYNITYNHIFNHHGTELGLISNINNSYYLQSLLNFTFETDNPMYGGTFGTWGPLIHNALRSTHPLYLINNGSINNITVTTLDGQILTSIPVSSIGIIQIDTSGWPVGSYNVKVIQNKGQADEKTSIKNYSNYYHGLLNNNIWLYYFSIGYSALYTKQTTLVFNPQSAIFPKPDIPFIKASVHKSFGKLDMQAYASGSNNDAIGDFIMGYFTNGFIPFVETGSSLYGGGLATGINANIQYYNVTMKIGKTLTYQDSAINQYLSFDPFTVPGIFFNVSSSATFGNSIVVIFFNGHNQDAAYLDYLQSKGKIANSHLYDAGASYIYNLLIQHNLLSTSVAGSLSNNGDVTIEFTLGMIFNTSNSTSWTVEGTQSLLPSIKNHALFLRYANRKNSVGLQYNRDNNNTSYTINSSRLTDKYNLSGEVNYNNPINSVTYAGQLFSTLGIGQWHMAWNSFPVTAASIINLKSINEKSKAIIQTEDVTEVVNGSQNILLPIHNIFMNKIIHVRPMVSNFESGDVSALGSGYFPGTVTYIPFYAHSIRIVIGQLLSSKKHPLQHFIINGKNIFNQTDGSFQVDVRTTDRILTITDNKNQVLCKIHIPFIIEPNILFLGPHICNHNKLFFLRIPHISGKKSFVSLPKSNAEQQYITLKKNNILILHNTK